jgi:type II secretory pathway pseudopilin PulG
MSAKKTLRHFTIIELLTVIGIIGVLIGIVMGLMSLGTNKAAEARTKALIAQLSVALENYKTKYGYYLQAQYAQAFYLDRVDNAATPADDTQKITNNFCQFIDFEQMRNKSCTKTPATATALKDMVFNVVDGWGYPLIYRCPGYFNRNGYDLGSVGADGKYGSTTTAYSLGSLSTDNTYKTSAFGQGDDITNFTR